jgi:hypothetical protein
MAIGEREREITPNTLFSIAIGEREREREREMNMVVAILDKGLQCLIIFEDHKF